MKSPPRFEPGALTRVAAYLGLLIASQGLAVLTGVAFGVGLIASLRRS